MASVDLSTNRLLGILPPFALNLKPWVDLNLYGNMDVVCSGVNGNKSGLICPIIGPPPPPAPPPPEIAIDFGGERIIFTHDQSTRVIISMCFMISGIAVVYALAIIRSRSNQIRFRKMLCREEEAKEEEDEAEKKGLSIGRETVEFTRPRGEVS